MALVQLLAPFATFCTCMWQFGRRYEYPVYCKRFMLLLLLLLLLWWWWWWWGGGGY